MLKKLLACFLCACLLALSACTPQNDPPAGPGAGSLDVEDEDGSPASAADEDQFTNQAIGISFPFPDALKPYRDQGLNFSYTDQPYQFNEVTVKGIVAFDYIPPRIQEMIEEFQLRIQNGEEVSQEEYEQIYVQMLSDIRQAGAIFAFQKEELAARMDETKLDLSAFTQLSVNEKLGEKGDTVFYFSYPQDASQGLAPEEAAVYQGIREAVLSIKDSISLSEPVVAPQADAGSFPAFSTVDVEGNEVTEDIFSGYELTMVNVWGTFCGPCIQEMPDLEELYQEMDRERFNLIGLVADVTDPSGIPEATEIIGLTGVTYQNILPDEALQQILYQVTGVPTTFFVDSKGKVVGEPSPGARSKEQYVALLEERAAMLEE